MALIASTMTLVTFTHDAAAQSRFRRGELAVNVDYALGHWNSETGWQTEKNKTHGVGMMVEYGLLSVLESKVIIAVGMQLGYSKGGDDFDGIFKEYKFTRVRIGSRCTAHCSFTPMLDTYAGLSFLFVDMERHEWDTEIKKTRVVPPGVLIGCRYMFNEHFGANVELGADRFQTVGVGVTFKP